MKSQICTTKTLSTASCLLLVLIKYFTKFEAARFDYEKFSHDSNRFLSSLEDCNAATYFANNWIWIRIRIRIRIAMIFVVIVYAQDIEQVFLRRCDRIEWSLRNAIWCLNKTSLTSPGLWLKQWVYSVKKKKSTSWAGRGKNHNPRESHRGELFANERRRITDIWHCQLDVWKSNALAFMVVARALTNDSSLDLPHQMSAVDGKERKGRTFVFRGSYEWSWWSL